MTNTAMASTSGHGRLSLQWSPNNRVHAHVSICAAIKSNGDRPMTLRREKDNAFIVPKKPDSTITMYIFSNQEKSDDDHPIVGCCIGSASIHIKEKTYTIAGTSRNKTVCDVLCKTTNRTFHQGEITAFSDDFYFEKVSKHTDKKPNEFNEFVSKELHCFGLSKYSPYNIDFLSVVDQTSCEPIACVDHIESNEDGDDPIFSMVGYEGSRTLSEWSNHLNCELGLYKHPILFKAAVPIAERVHLTEWTPLHHSIPAALFFTQFDDAAELTEQHLLATLEVALKRNEMSQEDFVNAVTKQASMSNISVCPEFELAVSVCAESATVLPNAFHYRTDSTRDPRTGKLVMMDKMERLNGWVRRSYGDCEDMTAYMTQHLHTLRESKSMHHPVTRAAHQLMQSYMPIATLGSVTYVGSGGAKLADTEYKATNTMYSDGNAAHMWTMMIPEPDIMRMLDDDTNTFLPWQHQLSLRVCEGTSRMSPNMFKKSQVSPSIKSLYANHHHTKMMLMNKASRALSMVGVSQFNSKASITLDGTMQHPFYKRPTHIFTPSLQSNPKYANVMQFVFCKETVDGDLEYSMPFDALMQKNACYKLHSVPVCGESIKKRFQSQVLCNLPLCEPMSASGRRQDTQSAKIDTLANPTRVSSAKYEHDIWARGDHMHKLDLIVNAFASQHTNDNNKRLSVLASLESLGVDAPLTTHFKFSSQDVI